jgi:hypothetical protein
MSDTSKNQVRQFVYQELCKSYLQIDDFRSKLLAALPVASAGSAFLLVGDKLVNFDKLKDAAPLMTPIAVFGIVVTLALFCYEIYGIKKCGALIDAGKSLEIDMGVAGQFTSRPNKIVNEPLAAAIIYPAVIAGWMYLVLYSYGLAAGAAAPGRAIRGAAATFLLGFVPMLIWDIRLFLKSR